MKAPSDLKARGCLDAVVAVTDARKGMSEALATIFYRRRCKRASSI
jgi:transposase-like protein